MVIVAQVRVVLLVGAARLSFECRCGRCICEFL